MNPVWVGTRLSGQLSRRLWLPAGAPGRKLPSGTQPSPQPRSGYRARVGERAKWGSCSQTLWWGEVRPSGHGSWVPWTAPGALDLPAPLFPGPAMGRAAAPRHCGLACACVFLHLKHVRAAVPWGRQGLRHSRTGRLLLGPVPTWPLVSVGTVRGRCEGTTLWWATTEPGLPQATL